jgi:hypothetical protein
MEEEADLAESSETGEMEGEAGLAESSEADEIEGREAESSDMGEGKQSWHWAQWDRRDGREGRQTWRRPPQAALWNRNYFLRFWFRLSKSYGSGSGSNFWKVMVPVPVLTFEKVTVLVPAP